MDEPTRQEKIAQYLPLVSSTVKRMSGLFDSALADSDDAIGYGVLGLINAVDHFDPSKGDFNSYARLRIHGSIVDAYRKLDFLPRTVRRRRREVEKVNADLAHCLGRQPTVEELAQQARVSVEDVQHLRDGRLGSIHSLDRTPKGRDGESRWQVSDDDESIDPVAVVENAVTLEALREALSALSERELRLIKMRYTEGLPFRKIGDRLNISEARVIQIHFRTLSRLKRTLQDAA
jgi:RNA polymerase sigma factor for flagellar operon FliA